MNIWAYESRVNTCSGTARSGRGQGVLEAGNSVESAEEQCLLTERFRQFEPLFDYRDGGVSSSSEEQFNDGDSNRPARYHNVFDAMEDYFDTLGDQEITGLYQMVMREVSVLYCCACSSVRAATKASLRRFWV